MKRLIELVAIVLLMAIFVLLIFAVFVGTVVATSADRTAPCSQPVYEDVQEQIRDEVVIQGGLICR